MTKFDQIRDRMMQRQIDRSFDRDTYRNRVRLAVVAGIFVFVALSWFVSNGIL